MKTTISFSRLVYSLSRVFGYVWRLLSSLYRLVSLSHCVSVSIFFFLYVSRPTVLIFWLCVGVGDEDGDGGGKDEVGGDDDDDDKTLESQLQVAWLVSLSFSLCLSASYLVRRQRNNDDGKTRRLKRESDGCFLPRACWSCFLNVS